MSKTIRDKMCKQCKYQKVFYSSVIKARILGCKLDNSKVGCIYAPIDSDKLDATYYENLEDMHEWDDLSSGDAIIVMKRQSSDRDSRIEALGVLIRRNDNELRYLKRSELKYNYEIISGRHMTEREFQANTLDSLILLLEDAYKRVCKQYD